MRLPPSRFGDLHGHGPAPELRACPQEVPPGPPLEAEQPTQTILPDVAASPSTSLGRADALLGQQLGDYVVRRYIGSGGMGIVYEGEHVTIGRKAAIKLIRDEVNKGPHARGLLAEARAASAIQHRGIIDIFGFGEQPGVGQYLVMEYLEGRPLSELIAKRAPLSLTETFALLCEVLDALSAAHAMGVTHRDLKPSNIFVARQSNGAETLKVLDFGLAKRSATPEGTTPQTRSDVIVGTPQYMAPEQALGDEVGPRTDLYAVGIIAFELLTGRRPFLGRSHMEVVAHHLKSPPPLPSSFVALPAEVDTLVLRLLAKDPHQRPASASAVACELRALLQQQESSSLSEMRRSRSSSVVMPFSDAAPAQAPTETLQPASAVPEPEAAMLHRPPRLGPWLKWSAAPVSVLAVLLGVRMSMDRASTQATLEVTSPATAAAQQPPVPPVASSLNSELTIHAPSQVLPSPPTLEPVLTSAVSSRGPEPLPARRKTRMPKQPAPLSIVSAQPPTALAEPLVARAATGTLHVVVKGAWADVWVDGKKLGRVPPLHDYTLTEGEHELELRHPAFPHYRRTVVIPPGESLTHQAEFSASGQGFPR
ncbi:protein kinase domain-containing protein [Hyalangium rubrum]|uniref:Protein kinase n=1 Tax=Hyalangium rubrum TaxID=3103134 RepID=A0ABU5H937_9BACT|nr:protein kinase [Hyalangium sp. s54d21]MDY7229599.1 protein kinase [Hyalangium sp. s54d21]